MKRPLGAIRIEPETMTRKELKMYLAVLQDKDSWNPSLKYFVSAGEIVITEEIDKVKELLG